MRKFTIHLNFRMTPKHQKILEMVEKEFGLKRNKAIRIALNNYWIAKLKERKQL